MLAQSEWLRAKLKPRTSGELKVAVRLRSGQVSTFKVSSSTTVAAFKAKVAEAAIFGTPATLVYLGTPLDEAATLEACGIADGACLVETAAKAAAAEALDVVEPPTAAALYDRVKHNQARGMDLNFDTPSWHLDYKPYAEYVPPKDGKPQIQAAAYEEGGDAAWRRDYYVTGPGNQAEINHEAALKDAE
ncbi:hypothetical protein CTAYLR_006149 [Chrysophaeum taylorii]|uniref:Ubiquitin-like domain-containing protein n=1 Tax=Chrysophaeum taylorii TaxID=2483200 RepID=A0AAD7UQM3_9STRA|nr:hypothetical protein CTAYLR_006149 [Chrysophaeum taylorii]